MTTTLKKKGLLSGGLFDKPFMDSRATTNSVSTKEWVLGHLIGPLGLIFVVNTIAALVEKFFTQQAGAMYGVENVEMIRQMGGWYEIVMTVAKVLAMGIGLLNGWLIQNTESKQGRMRPWHLIFGFVSIIIGCLIFLFPGNSMGNIYWFYFFFLVICYHTVGSAYFYLFRDTICSLVTRDPKEKAFIQYIRKMPWTLISGIIIGMMISMVVLPLWLEKDINGYPVLMICLSAAAMVAQLCRRSWNLMDAKTLSMILGHASVAFTLDTYAHVLTDHKIEEMKRMQAVFNQAQFAQAIQPLSQNIPNS